MKLIGIARLGRDVDVRHTANGKAVASLWMAYDYGLKDESGARKTQWVAATLWGEQATRLQPYLLKGTALNVVCRDVHIEVYDGGRGAEPKLVGTIADIEFVPRQRERDEAQQPAQRAAAMPAATSGSFADMDDDIPF